LDIEARVATEIVYEHSVFPEVVNPPQPRVGNYSPQVEEESLVTDESEIGQIKTALAKRRKAWLVTALDGARQVTLEGNELFVEFTPETRHLRDPLSRSDNVKILCEVCKEVTGRDLGVRFVIADGEGSAAPVSKEEAERREQQNLRELAEQDPSVQQLLRTFRGEIVDVKRLDEKS
jgi:hypothetical protein